ncbi:MnhB domain-containing protein [Natrialbaceae archaeon AArc-T1-2]|uniref:MnhB domain-containing protein n=1 Tax=Natrialbaceae archaeon AArc-T1-2 TaxID=3053904 RepID=UPI00255AC2F3|nr:MnhB domain-containing protein [Natrialbaceae archaeon AArc-T1-2]WIV66201.1 MnhB domain-containing protein [Natrialbaceae archaeon AArc-T1-2]
MTMTRDSDTDTDDRRYNGAKADTSDNADSVAEPATPVDDEFDVPDTEVARGATPVTQSPVIKTVSRTVTPFVVAFGVYITLFGTSLPGGAFQGGIVMGSAVVLIGLAFGFDPTQEWLDARALGGLFLLGAGLFGAVAVGGVVFGGAVLELFVFPLSVEDMVKLVEVAIAALVTGVVIGLVIWLSSGVIGGEKT